MREVADRHPGVRREREARKRGPRHRFWPSVAAAGAVADGHSAWEGSQKLKIDALKRQFRVGGVTNSIYWQPPDRPSLAAVTLYMGSGKDTVRLRGQNTILKQCGPLERG